VDKHLSVTKYSMMLAKTLVWNSSQNIPVLTQFAWKNGVYEWQQTSTKPKTEVDIITWIQKTGQCINKAVLTPYLCYYILKWYYIDDIWSECRVQNYEVHNSKSIVNFTCL
jgi:hypothetical protein